MKKLGKILISSYIIIIIGILSTVINQYKHINKNQDLSEENANNKMNSYLNNHNTNSYNSPFHYFPNKNLLDTNALSSSAPSL